MSTSTLASSQWLRGRGRTRYRRQLWTLGLVLSLVATACGSASDAGSIDAGSTTTESATAAEPTTVVATGGEAEPTEEPIEVESEDDPATSPSGGDESVAQAPTIAIEGDVKFESPTNSGMFRVTAGSDVLGCENGTLNDRFAYGSFVYDLTCASGTRSGTFMTTIAPEMVDEGELTSPWSVVLGTDGFGAISGSGQWRAVINEDGAGATWAMTGDVVFGEVAEPISSMARPVKAHLSECVSGFISKDGLFEYANVDEVLVRVDLTTGERSEHGPSPSECAWWLGDEAAGRRIAISPPSGAGELPFDKVKVWFGPFDGPWDVEVEFDENTTLLSRSFTGNRLVFSQLESGSVVILDATTGEQVGSAIAGFFGSERGPRGSSSANATSPDGTFIALGSANPGGENGDGRVFVLDAQTGDELFRLDTTAAASAAVFDDGGELVVGLVNGELLTIDIATEEVVSTVRIEAATWFDTIGIRPDGLVVAYTGVSVELIDRRTGPTGASIFLRDNDSGRIRPDGTVGSFGTAGYFEVYEIDG